MKRAILSVIALLVCISLFAQQVEMMPVVKPFKRNEAGLILFESSVSERPLSYFQNALAVQYKRWKYENFGYRFSFGVNSFRLEDVVFNRQILANDTFMEQRHVTDATIPMVSAGVEAQRHFFRAVHFFVAADVRMGFGEGTRVVETKKQYPVTQNNQVYYATSLGISGHNSDLTMLRIGLVPSLGAKMQLRRVTFGYEAALHFFAFHQEKYRQSRLSNFELDLNSFTTRLFVNYRFGNR